MSRLLISTLVLMCLSSQLIAVLAEEREFPKTSFEALNCKGEKDEDLFYQLNYICEDCVRAKQLTDEVVGKCRDGCFTTEFFPSCLVALLRKDEQEEFRQKVEKINGKGFEIIQ